MAIQRQLLKIFSTRYRDNTLHEDVTEFLDQLALLLGNNVPETEALELLQDGWSSRQMGKIVTQLKNKTAAGATLVAAMGEQPSTFEPFLLELMETASREGKLPEVLKEIANYKQMSAEVSFSSSGRLYSTLFYPAAVILIAVIITTILTIFVVPQFESLFAGFGADLPSLTRFVLDISNSLQTFWWAILLLVIIVPIAWIRQKNRSANFHHFAIRILMKIPGYGNLYRQGLSAQLLYSWALMLNCGQTLKQAVTNSSSLRIGPYYQQLLREIGSSMGDKTPLHSLLEKQESIFSSRLAKVIKMSDRAEVPQQLLHKLALAYQNRLELRLKTMSTLHEVLVMIVIGLMVGTLVIAMYLPIFSMGSAVG